MATVELVDENASPSIQQSVCFQPLAAQQGLGGPQRAGGQEVDPVADGADGAVGGAGRVGDAGGSGPGGDGAAAAGEQDAERQLGQASAAAAVQPGGRGEGGAGEQGGQ